MLENVPNIWIFQKNSLYLPTSKGNLWLSGQNPAREQDFIDTTPLFFCQRCFLTIRAESREGKTISTLPQKRVSIFMMLTYFFVIIRCLKNKTQIFLAVCKIQCTFAAKLVFS